MRLVRPIILPAVLCAAPCGALPPAAASLEPADPSPVTIRESIVYHRTGDSVAGICAAPVDVVGCTVFPSERIESACTARDGAWALESRATLDAEIHLSSRRAYNLVLDHEHLHLTDLRRGLVARLESLASLRFDSRDDCTHMARVVSSAPFVRDVLNALRTASNEKYRCQRPSRRRGR